VDWILDLDTRGSPPRHAFVKNMAENLLSERSDGTIKEYVGDNWVSLIYCCILDDLVELQSSSKVSRSIKF
jgi:hypothetical protein